MKRIFLMIALAASCASMAHAQQPPVLNLVSPDDQSNAREEELYRDGTDYLDENKWSEALQKFDQVAALKGRRADGALYWKAYALNKLGRRQESLNSITALRNSFPKSQWLKDASALEVEVKQASGGRVSPEAAGDEETKLLALNSIMESDPDRAVPIIEKMLANPSTSPRVKERALFVLAQADSPKAQQMVADMARGKSGPALQTKAIQFMGTEPSPANMKALGEIYTASSDKSVKRAVLQAYLVGDNQAGVLAAAKAESDPDLRRFAIQQLGAMDATKEIEQLYPGSDAATKHAILDACVAADDSSFLAKVAKDASESIDLRRGALQRLGAVGGKEVRSTLVQVYKTDSNPDMKRAAIEGLFVDDADADLIALARAETNPQLKRDLIEKLSVMDSRAAKDYMLEILNK